MDYKLYKIYLLIIDLICYIDKKLIFSKENLMPKNFTIVGIGASAGGIQALEEFFQNLPNDLGMAYIIIMHLAPDRKSNLDDILQKKTKMIVKPVIEGINVKPNHVYLIPPNRDLDIKNHTLYLSEFDPSQKLRLPIDHFFRSLAQQYKKDAVGILLSGTGSDGTLGLREIKGLGGITIVQNPETASYQEMLFNAIKHVDVDIILSPSEIANKLAQYKDSIHKIPKLEKSLKSVDIDNYFNELYGIIQNITGHDLSGYRKTTIGRRIEKRMSVNQIYDIEKYLNFLRRHPEESEKLFFDILIGVTNFFRDKDVFLSIEKNVIPQIFNDKSNHDPIRIWIVGCSTGEEAYSIAILLKEFANKNERQNEITIFATDIDSSAVNRARHGVYPKNIEADISKERLKRYFTRVDDQYSIKKEIRKMLIFAEQNVLEDPPFSKMDMVTCRNLLIYLQPEFQRDLLRTLVYALKTNSFLVLGTADSLGDVLEIFEEIDTKAKIYKKRKAIIMKDKYRFLFPTKVNLRKENAQLVKREKPKKFEELVENVLLETFSPPSILVNRDKEIIYIHGDLSKYLNLPKGIPKLDLIEMTKSNLGLGLTTAFRQAIHEETEATYNKVESKENGVQSILSVSVKPLQERGMGMKLYLVSFKETEVDFTEIPRLEMKAIDTADDKIIKHLENELESTKINLQQTIEEFETSNEELKSSNEELQSANEELQTTNEELQTSKEELQSVNEELRTVNEELSAKNLQLSKLNDDLDNLISSTQIATIFLDTALNIQKYTPQTTEVLNLIPSDIGRPFHHISPKLVLHIKDIVEDANQVLNKLVPIQKDVTTEDNKWYRMKISPYRTSENVIEGIVITFVDFTERHLAEDNLVKSEENAKFAYRKSEFYRSLFTHDISNILQVILSTVNIIERHAKDFEEKDELKDFFSTIQEQITKARNLVSDIQRLTNLDKKIVEIIPIDLIEYINQSIETLTFSYPNEKYKVEFNPKYKKIMIKGTKILEDCFQNILNNAITYNENEIKYITIRIEEVQKHDIEYIQVIIEDNGVGIKGQLIEGIMNNNYNKNNYKGLGIGLSLVRKTLELINGEFRIEDRVRGDYTKGTRVILLIPKISIEPLD